MASNKRKKITLDEAVALIEHDDDLLQNTEAIYVCPPEGAGSDEDSGGEEDEHIGHFTRNQLLAETEIVTCTRNNVDDEETYQDSQGDSNPSAPTTSKTKRRRIEKKERVWSTDNKENVIDTAELPPMPDFFEDEMTATEVFERFFDQEMIDYFVEETNRFAVQQGVENLNVNNEEMKVFLAIHLLSGYVPLPRRYMYWEVSDDVQNLAVSNSMRRNRFIQIMRYFHLTDNDHLDQCDKFAKVRPFCNRLNEHFRKFCLWNENVNVDESMCPYFGKHGAKMFIRGKPIRFGFKIWCLNTATGYLIQFEPYGGKSSNQSFSKHREELGLAGSVVMGLCEVLPNLNAGSFRLFIDNYFTSLHLIEKLMEKGILCSGTIRCNRLDKCPISSVETMRKKPRGSYDACLETSSSISIIRWNDNSVVTIASSQHGCLPEKQVLRWNKQERKRITVEQPHSLAKYNASMGGTDLMDQMISSYRTQMRNRKWWYTLFRWGLDAAVCNAFLLFRSMPSTARVDLLSFRRSVAMTWLRRYGVLPTPGRVLASKPVLNRSSKDIRFDGLNHLIIVVQKERRCALCKVNVKRACSKCGVHLHDKCFFPYHSQ